MQRTGGGKKALSDDGARENTVKIALKLEASTGIDKEL